MNLDGLRSVNFFLCPQTDVKAHGKYSSSINSQPLYMAKE